MNVLTLSVAELKCNISVKKVLEADVLDSLLMLAPLGTALGLGSEQHKICWRTLKVGLIKHKIFETAVPWS